MGGSGGSAPAAQSSGPSVIPPMPKVPIGAQTVRPPLATTEGPPKKKAVPPSFVIAEAPEDGSGSGGGTAFAEELPANYWDHDKEPQKVWTAAPALVMERGEEELGENVDMVLDTPRGPEEVLDIRETELATLEYEDGNVYFGATNPDIWRSYLRDTVTHIGALTLGKAHRAYLKVLRKDATDEDVLLLWDTLIKMKGLSGPHVINPKQFRALCADKGNHPNAALGGDSVPAGQQEEGDLLPADDPAKRVYPPGERNVFAGNNLFVGDSGFSMCSTRQGKYSAYSMAREVRKAGFTKTTVDASLGGTLGSLVPMIQRFLETMGST